MAKITVFGAGAMGTAIAIHLARKGNETSLWASPYDENVLSAVREERRHPALPEHFPESLNVLGPDELAAVSDGIDIGVMGAHAGGARTLAKIVRDGSSAIPLVVSIAKGLEPSSGRRMTEVYSEELEHHRIVAMGGPCLAPEIAHGLPTFAIFAATDDPGCAEAAEAFRSKRFGVQTTDDVAGVEYCAVFKNVAAIGIGILDGIGKLESTDYRNAKAALFVQAFAEVARLVVALGGRAETVGGAAGLGDLFVTSVGGRNRLFGELIGGGAEPKKALAELNERGMTVEGVDSAAVIGRLAAQADVNVPFLMQVRRIIIDGAPAESVLEPLGGWR